jgi:hypothetical protein
LLLRQRLDFDADLAELVGDQRDELCDLRRGDFHRQLGDIGVLGAVSH